MKVFIGSSSEAKKDMERIAMILEEENHEPITWDDAKIFIARKMKITENEKYTL